MNNHQKLNISDDNDVWGRLTETINLNEVHPFKSYINSGKSLDICREWTEDDIICDILDKRMPRVHAAGVTYSSVDLP